MSKPLRAMVEEVVMPARDGVALAHRPVSGRGPAILLRAPYGRSALSERTLEVDLLAAVRAGFTVVLQDVRGRGGSDGTFGASRCDVEDGADAVAWIRRQQPWSNGRVCMTGGSYSGCLRLQAARARPEGLAALAPSVSGALRTIWYPGGALRLSGLAGWMTRLLAEALPAAEPNRRAALSELLDASPLERFHALVDPASPAWEVGSPIRHWLAPADDPFWRETVAPPQATLPALHTSGWYDACLAATVEAFEAWSAARDPAAPQLLTLGPWDHVPGGAYPDLGLGAEQAPAANVALDRQLRFFQAILDGRALDEIAPVLSFVLGRNRWHESTGWPLPDARPVVLALTADGGLRFETPATRTAVR